MAALRRDRRDSASDRRLTILAEGGAVQRRGLPDGADRPTELAGHTIALQVAAIVFQVPFGVGQAATIRVGYHYGAPRPPAIGRAGGAAIAVGIGSMALTASIDAVRARLVLGIYVDTGAGQCRAVAFAVRTWSSRRPSSCSTGPGGRRRRAARAAGYAHADVVRAVRLLAAGLRDRDLLGFSTPLEGLGVWIGLAARPRRRRAAAAAALEAACTGSVLLPRLTQICRVTARGRPRRANHMRPAGTLHVGVQSYHQSNGRGTP